MIAAALLLAAAPAVASSGVTSFGRDIVISQPVAGRVVAVLSDVRIDAPVSGDVIVWGGDVSFGPSGEVRSNLSVFGGDVARASGRLPVRGTVSTPGTLLRFYLDEMQRAPWQTGERPATLTGLRLIVLAVWLALGLLLLYMFGSPFARAAASAESNWTAAMLAGVLGVLALFVTAAAALAILPAAISVPVVLLVALLGVAAKVFGMAALFLLLGQKIMRRFAPARRPSDLAIGFLLLGAISLVPLVGGVVWSAASVVAVGIALTSRFGTPKYRVPFA
jgi:hypothetical protein